MRVRVYVKRCTIEDTGNDVQWGRRCLSLKLRLVYKPLPPPAGSLRLELHLAIVLAAAVWSSSVPHTPVTARGKNKWGWAA